MGGSVTVRLNGILGLVIPAILRVVMVRGGRGGDGGEAGGDGEKIVPGVETGDGATGRGGLAEVA